jgi:hypothetical protein
MANKKAEQTTEAVQEVQAEQTTEETKATTEAGAKVYRFKSANKYLSCVALGVQFINGTATTSNLEVAKKLVKIEGVELVEE